MKNHHLVSCFKIFHFNITKVIESHCSEAFSAYRPSDTQTTSVMSQEQLQNKLKDLFSTLSQHKFEKGIWAIVIM